MSKQWWETAKTTQGHGIFSQYKPDHLKEWIGKETRRQEHATSSSSDGVESLTLHRASLFFPTEGKHIEKLHNANCKHLNELRAYQSAPSSPAGCTTRNLSGRADDPCSISLQPLQSKYYPQMTHHHYFGWLPPTPEAPIGAQDTRIHRVKYGEAQAYNQKILAKSAFLSVRK